MKIVKGKKPRRYNVLVMPEGSATVRRVGVPRWSIKFVAGVVAGWVFVTVVLIGGVFYYRAGWLATSDVRRRNEELAAEKTRMTEKLVSIEQLSDRTTRLAARLETVMGISKKGLDKGIGPVSEDDNLPSAKLFTTTRKYGLNSDSIGDAAVSFNDLELEMDGLEDSLASVEIRLHDVYEYHQDKLAYWASIPSIWPVRGWVTSSFGVRRSPRGVGTRFHEGLDIAAPRGTAIRASGDGVVTFAGYKRGLGNTVIIDHGFGISTVYGHGSQLYVREGDRVRRGTSIATVGNSGRSTGPHLHYQVMVDGLPVDPLRYIIENF